MIGKIDAFLKVSVIVSILFASSSVGYYYVVYLPRRDAEQDAERRLDRARAEADKRADRERIVSEQRALEQRQLEEKAAAQVRYQTCVRSAESNHLSSWASECKRLAGKSVQDLSDCLKQFPNSMGTCDQIHKLRDASSNCGLPRVIATDLETDLEKTRNRCLQENRAGLQ